MVRLKGLMRKAEKRLPEEGIRPSDLYYFGLIVTLTGIRLVNPNSSVLRNTKS